MITAAASVPPATVDDHKIDLADEYRTAEQSYEKYWSHAATTLPAVLRLLAESRQRVAELEAELATAARIIEQHCLSDEPLSPELIEHGKSLEPLAQELLARNRHAGPAAG